MLRTGLFSWGYENRTFKAGLEITKIVNDDGATIYKVWYINRQLRIYDMRMIFETVPPIPCVEKKPEDTYSQVIDFMHELVRMNEDLEPFHKNITPEGKKK